MQSIVTHYTLRCKVWALRCFFNTSIASFSDASRGFRALAPVPVHKCALCLQIYIPKSLKGLCYMQGSGSIFSAFAPKISTLSPLHSAIFGGAGLRQADQTQNEDFRGSACSCYCTAKNRLPSVHDVCLTLYSLTKASLPPQNKGRGKTV